MAENEEGKMSDPRPCVICGNRIPDCIDLRRPAFWVKTCSKPCSRELRQRRRRLYERRRERKRKRNPGYLARRVARQKARRKERYATDPAFRAKIRATARERYAANPEYFLCKVREWQARQLTPEMLAAREARRLRSQLDRERRAANRERMLEQQRFKRDHPELWRELRAQKRRECWHRLTPEQRLRDGQQRRLRMSSEERARHRATDRERAAKRRAILTALRELGWVKGLEVVSPTDPLTSPPPRKKKLSATVSAIRRRVQHKLSMLRRDENRPALRGQIVVVDPNGTACIVIVDRAEYQRDYMLRYYRRFHKPRRHKLTDEQRRERRKAQNYKRRNRTEQTRRYRLKRDALLQAVRELGLLDQLNTVSTNG
jgi:hypothetical protein